MKTAFFVVGPESSGNHLLCELLKRMGCFWEDEMPISQLVQQSDKVVIRRSIPHGYSWPNPEGISCELLKYGFLMKSLIPIRDWLPTILSNFHRRKGSVGEAVGLITRAYSHLAKCIANKSLDPFWFVNVSTLFVSPAPEVTGVELFTGLRYMDKDFNWIYDADRSKQELIIMHEGIFSITKQEIEERVKREIEIGARHNGYPG